MIFIVASSRRFALSPGADGAEAEPALIKAGMGAFLWDGGEASPDRRDVKDDADTVR